MYIYIYREREFREQHFFLKKPEASLAGSKLNKSARNLLKRHNAVVTQVVECLGFPPQHVLRCRALAV